MLLNTYLENFLHLWAVCANENTQEQWNFRFGSYVGVKSERNKQFLRETK
jgi:hypothetical protein